jgi:hypothetical protein
LYLIGNKNINYSNIYLDNKYRVFLPNEDRILNLSDKHKYIIGLIYYGLVFNRTICDYVPLNAKILKNIIGRYWIVLNELIDNGIIESDNKYIIKRNNKRGKSKGFRLTSEYQHKGVVGDFISDNKINESINLYKKEIPKIRHLRFLYDNISRTEFDDVGATRFIKEEYHIALNKAKSPQKKKEATDRYNALKISIDYLKRQDIFFTDDPTAGRVHNNITNLSKDLRKFLSFEGKNLIGIDIKNAQPLLLNILVENYIREQQKEKIKKEFTPYGSPIKDLDYKNNVLSEIEKYKKLTSDGELYDYLMELMDYSDRGKFKKELYSKFFYCDLNKPYSLEFRKVFENNFPTITQIIDSIKKEDYKQFAIKLQRLESDIMIKKIVKRIHSERKDMFILTIHDSILSTPDNSDYITNIILEEFESNYNLKPSIKIEK